MAVEQSVLQEEGLQRGEGEGEGKGEGEGASPSLSLSLGERWGHATVSEWVETATTARSRGTSR